MQFGQAHLQQQGELFSGLEPENTHSAYLTHLLLSPNRISEEAAGHNLERNLQHLLKNTFKKMLM